MHALQFPSRQLPRFTIRSALLAIALTAIVLMAGAELSGRDGTSIGPATAPVTSEAVPVPLARPTVFNRPLQSPLTNLGQPALLGGETAVDGQRGPGDERGLVAQ